MVNKACAGPGGPYLNDSSHGKMNNQCSHLNRRFARPHVSDILIMRRMSAYSNMELEGQLFWFLLTSFKHFSVFYIHAHLLLETIHNLYGLQDAAKVS